MLLLLLLDVLTVDRAVENIGFGWFQIKLSLFTGLVWVCGAFIFLHLVVAIGERENVNRVVIISYLLYSVFIFGRMEVTEG